MFIVSVYEVKSRRPKQEVPLKRRYAHTKLHGVTTQKPNRLVQRKALVPY
jgi:hypothetical protein